MRRVILFLLLPLLASLSPAEVLPLEVRRIEAAYQKNDREQARELTQRFLADPAGQEWADRIEYIEVKSLLGESEDAFVARIGNLQANRPNHPVLPRLLRDYAKHLYEKGEPVASAGILTELLGVGLEPAEYAKTRLQLLDLYWESNQFKDADFLRAVESYPENKIENDGGRVDLRRGLIALRRSHDARAARGALQRAASVPDREVSSHARRAAADLLWIDLLIGAEDSEISEQEIADGCRNFIKVTQGGSGRETNPVIAASYMVKHADFLAEGGKAESAAKILHAVSLDPVFGKYRANAAHKCDVLRGVDATASRARMESETAAFAALEAALSLSESTPAQAALDKLIQDFPDSDATRDAMLRKAYLHIRGEKWEAALSQFESALARNADLGSEHPFNLEAAYRMKQVNHHVLYNRKQRPFEIAVALPENAELLDHVRELNLRWLEAVPSGSPEKWEAELERAGLVLEKALGSSDPQAYAAVRAELMLLLDDEECPRRIKAVADLMFLETYYMEGDYSTAISLAEAMKTKYPGHWREIGTAAVFARSAYIQMDDWDGAHEVMDWVLKNIPEDAPTFQTADYRIITILDKATQAKAEGNMDLYHELRRYAIEKFPDSRYNRIPW